MANPLISQGTLNRLRASVIWPGFPALNITAPFLGKEGIRLSLDGASTLFIPTMTGAVTSPEPYMGISLVLNLLKSQPIADLYKKQMESDARLGGGTVRPDASPLSPYEIINCAIEGVRELDLSGDSAAYAVMVKGYYNVNNALWDA